MSAYRSYSQNYNIPSQSRPIPGRETEMVPNNAGGYGFVLDKWQRLNRFLILGSEGGTYYVNQKTLTEQNAQETIKCIKEDGPRVVAEALAINVGNRAPKVDQQLFVLALALKHGDKETKAAVERAVPQMVRTGTHLLHFCDMINGLGGWNRTKRRIISKWFLRDDRDYESVAFQVLKYQNRDGWTMRDALRVAHPKTDDVVFQSIFDWVCGRTVNTDVLPKILQAHVAMRSMIDNNQYSPREAAFFGIDHRLPREALPTEALAHREVWEKLLQYTPYTALLRNLATLTFNGTLTENSPELQRVINVLTNKEAISKARVHPFSLLVAGLTYSSGYSQITKKSWTPILSLVSALSTAYETAFNFTTPTGKNIVFAVDISASMNNDCVKTPLPAYKAAMAMAFTMARIEPNSLILKFDTETRKVIQVNEQSDLSSLLDYTGGGTDLSAPIRAMISFNNYNKENNFPIVPIDAFVILTDDETWAGEQHASELLQHYRNTCNPYTKLVCCSMAANHANIVDPKDPLSMGCAGLDSSLPSLVSDFINSPILIPKD